MTWDSSPGQNHYTTTDELVLKKFMSSFCEIANALQIILALAVDSPDL